VSQAGEPPSGSGSTPWRWVPGSATGEVTVGQYTLAVGGAGGTVADPAPPEERSDPTPLRQALATEESEVEQALGRLSEGTGRVERAAQLVTDVAEGRLLDPKVLSREVDALLGLLTRLDKEGKYSDVLRLARSLSVLLALLLRWTALVHTLRVALRAARALADVSSQSWALHELGTLGLGADEAKAATRDLHQARDMRARIGDQEGLAATDHNLALLRAAAPWYARPVVRRLAIAGAVAAVVGVIVALALGGGSKEEPTAVAGTATSSTQATSATKSATRTTKTTSTTTTPATKPTVTLEIQSAEKEPEGRTNLTFGGSAGTDPADGDVTVEITPRGGGSPETVSASVGADGRWSARTILALGGYTAVALQEYGAGEPARSAPLSFSVRSGTVVTSTTTPATTTTALTDTTTVSSTTSSSDVIP